MSDEFFRLNGVDVGFGAQTDVRVRRGRLRLKLQTPALVLTRALHNGLCDGRWCIPDFYMEDGLRIVAPGDIGVPDGEYGSSQQWPWRGERGVLQQLHVYGPQTGSWFFGTVFIGAGWVELQGHVADGVEQPETDARMPVHVRKCFEPLPLIAPRRRFDLHDALNVLPDEVFDLEVANGHFDEFPTAILAFRNLERLRLRMTLGPADPADPADLALAEVPEGLFALENLHTLDLQWRRSAAGILSPSIARLTQLEELVLRLGLTELPECITTLPRLDTLVLDNNQLADLPERIGDMPALRTLSISGNRFASLPASLARVPEVNVEHPLKALYSDIGYVSRNPVPIDHGLYDLRSHPARQQAVAQALAGLTDDDATRALFLAGCTAAIEARPSPAPAPAALGRSKTGGAPHLPRGMAHPVGPNGRLFTFQAQLNLADIAPLQDFLPRNGWLYFFVSDSERAERARVLHADVGVEALQAHLYPGDARWIDGNLSAELLGGEALLDFAPGTSVPALYDVCAVDDRALRGTPYLHVLAPDDAHDPHTERLHALEHIAQQLERRLGHDEGHGRNVHRINSHTFTLAESPQEIAAAREGGHPHEWLNLLSLESIGEIDFWDSGTLSFCIHKQDLAISDFSRVVTVLESG